MTPSKRDRIRRLRKQGKTLTQIASVVGCSVATVYRHAGGISNKSVSAARNAERDQAIRRLRRQGLALQRIANVVGCCMEVVRDVAGDIPGPRRGRKPGAGGRPRGSRGRILVPERITAKYLESLAAREQARLPLFPE